MAIQQELEHVGDTRSIANHDHDLVHELSKRLDGVWRFDQYIANAEGHQEIQDFWRKLKQQDQENVKQLKQLIENEIKKACF